MAPASCWSPSALKPVPAVARRVDAGVDRHADEHEAHPEEHPGHPRADDVGHLPQLAAQPPPLRLERRPPDEHADRRRSSCAGARGRAGAHRRLERRPRSASRRARARRRARPPAAARSHAERRAQPADRASVTSAGRGSRKPSTGLRAPASSSGAARSAISRCWAMWAESSSSPSAWTGEKNPTTHSAIPGATGDLAARDGHAARAQHAQRAQVQRLGSRARGPGRRCPAAIYATARCARAAAARSRPPRPAST